MNHHTSGRSISLTSLFAGLLLLFTLPLQAGVVARLSSPTTALDQPVQLTLESQGEQNDSPDLSVLDTDFEILGRATQQSLSIINGSVSSRRSLILTLLPKRQGKLTIPSIPFGDQQTSPLTLEVTQQAVDNGVSAQQLVRVEVSLNKKTAYPEQEVILTLKLYQAAGVRGEHLDQPQPSLGDTRLQLLDESNYTIERDGMAYRVLERNYALYAYQTGKLEIAPVRFRGRSGGASIFNLFDDPFGSPPQTSRLIRTKSNSVSLQIKPIPSEFTGDHWLPASNVQLVETGIDNSTPIVAGKPVTRRIMLIADGLMSSQLPVLSPQVPDDIKPYEERPQLQERPHRTGISSSRESVVTLIPTRAGRFTLPAIEIPWWNTETEKQEVARLPEMTLEVLPGSTNDSPVVVTPKPLQTVDSASSNTERETAMPTAPVADPDGVHWLVWVLGAAWLVTLAGWWFSHRKRSPAEIPPKEVAEDAATDQAVTAAIDALIAAYRDGNPEAAREAWLRWGQSRWPDNPPHNLTRLAGRCTPKVAAVVISLEKALYSPAEETGWADLFDAATLKEKPDQTASPQPADEELLPLNP